MPTFKSISMARVNKFRKGYKITDIHELVNQILAGHWVYWNHKPQHPSFLGSMNLYTLNNAVKGGILFTTKENT